MMCTSLQVEVQKLLKQNEYFERSIDEMESELKEAIIDADTSEKDARSDFIRKGEEKKNPKGRNFSSCEQTARLDFA